MARILLVYGTTEGQTRKIAERIASELEKLEHEVEIRDSATIADHLAKGGFDAVMIGASVHRGRHQTAVQRFVSANLGVLEQLPTAFFSVSLVASSADPEDRKDAENLIEAFCEKTSWRPALTRCIPGALRYTEYGFLMRWIMKLIVRHYGGPTDSSRDYEFTDWEDVDRFTRQFASLCVPPCSVPVDDSRTPP
jgi:menaquinone-dependent protoporphyrinogen oxidase